MPFSASSKRHTEDYWNRHFEFFLKPLIETGNELEAFRSTPLRQEIVRQIVSDLVFSHIVVADLTDNNPNVYWELGVRQSFRHGTITIAEGGSKIPFNIASKSVLFYNPENHKNEKFNEEFKQAIMDCLSHPDRPDSAVLETVTGRGSIYAIIHREELIRRVDWLVTENRLNSTLMGQILEAAYLGFQGHFWNRTTAVITTRLSYSALDLLLAEHYLEEDSEFYEHISVLLAMIHTINHYLATWTYETSKMIKKWFLENEQFLKELLRQHGQQMVAVREKLAATI
jgi:hypothetical protein